MLGYKNLCKIKRRRIRVLQVFIMVCFNKKFYGAQVRAKLVDLLMTQGCRVTKIPAVHRKKSNVYVKLWKSMVVVTFLSEYFPRLTFYITSNFSKRKDLWTTLSIRSFSAKKGLILRVLSCKLKKCHYSCRLPWIK